VVRGFARHLHAIDPTHEVPPVGLLPGRSHRATLPVFRRRHRPADGHSVRTRNTRLAAIHSLCSATTQTCGVLRVWRSERRGEPCDPLFPSRRRGPLSRDTVALLVAKHVGAATQRCLSLGTKTVSPHVLRHTCAMSLLAVGVDISVIALWLGHEGVETTQMYLHADIAIKERALARTAPAGTKPGRHQAPDTLLAFLEALLP
jgi:integrase-like protein